MGRQRGGAPLCILMTVICLKSVAARLKNTDLQMYGCLLFESILKKTFIYFRNYQKRLAVYSRIGLKNLACKM